MAFVKLVYLHQLFDGFRAVFQTPVGELLYVHEEGRSYLFKNRCPHAQQPLDKATISGKVLRCPAHGKQFHLDSGQPLSAVDCGGKLEFIPILYEGNAAGIDLSL